MKVDYHTVAPAVDRRYRAKDTLSLPGTVPPNNAVLLRFAPLLSATNGCRAGPVSSPNFPLMTQDQIKDLKGRAEALRRYL
ncbi:hypothetical protein GCM10022409_46230 [Hymenobacter glaciei]|uniref:Uncharacterized protein n=1 Tax=Hymenobacter glaciei TaxID=877209 RepID=A0ABP7UVI1_9BACT